MSHEDSVTAWLSDLKAGGSDAANKIWNRYVEQLVRHARRKLVGVPRVAADEEDVVLSAFDRFLNGLSDGRFVKLNDRHDLWHVLVMLTDRQAAALRRREFALKRGGGRVRDETDVGCGQEIEPPFQLDQIAGREPTPAFAAEMAQQLGLLLARLKDDVFREIALGKLEGRTNKELAESLSIDLRTVERKLSIIRDTWRDENPEDD